jgi:hypothetical protein
VAVKIRAFVAIIAPACGNAGIVCDAGDDPDGQRRVVPAAGRQHGDALQDRGVAGQRPALPINPHHA